MYTSVSLSCSTGNEALNVDSSIRKAGVDAALEQSMTEALSSTFVSDTLMASRKNTGVIK